MSGAEGDPSAFELLLSLFLFPMPAPITNPSPPDEMPSKSVAPFCGLPTTMVTGSKLPEASGALVKQTLNENLLPDGVDLVPSAEAKVGPLQPVASSDLMPEPSIKTDSDVAIHAASKLDFVVAKTPTPFSAVAKCPTSSVAECPTDVTPGTDQVQSEKATTASTTASPVIERSPEIIVRAANETRGSVLSNTTHAGDTTHAGESSSKSTTESVPADSMPPINSGPLTVNEVESAASGVEVVSTEKREHPISSRAWLAETSPIARFDFEQYRHFITNTSLSGPGPDEFSPDEFGRGSIPLHSMDGSGSGSALKVADRVVSGFEKVVDSLNDHSESVRSPEHFRHEETFLTGSALLPHGHVLTVTKDSAGAVSDQLTAAIVGRLEASHDSTHTTFRLRLDPRELGTVEVHLSMVHDVVSIRFVAQDETARQAIEQQLDELRQSLTNSGVTLSQCHVGCHSGDRHPPHQHEAAPQPYTRPPAASSRWNRQRDDELPTTLLQGRLNFVA